MKTISSTRGFSIIVDDEDYERVNRYRWHAARFKDGREHRPVRGVGKGEKRKLILLAREIINAPAGLVVDHIDGDPWNNLRSNLRVCTSAENSRNRRKHRTGRGEFKGVYQLPSGRHQAAIGVNGKSIYLGSFDTAEEAARAYDRGAVEHHGEFARLNFSPAPSSRAGAKAAFTGSAPRSPVGAADLSVGLANLDGLAAAVRLSPLASLAVAGELSA
jgi:hypothetical protein